MGGTTRLFSLLWLLGHATIARMHTPEPIAHSRRLPFVPDSLAASGRWWAALRADDEVLVARSSDGGRSWEKLPSPEKGGELSIGADGTVEIDGAEWHYWWSEGRWLSDELAQPRSLR